MHGILRGRTLGGLAALLALTLLVAHLVPELLAVVGGGAVFVLGAFDDPIFVPGLKAGADLSAAANQYKFVKLDANGDVVLCSARGEFALGSLYNLPVTGKPAQVAGGGTVLLSADAAIDEQAAVTTSADAQASPVTNAATGKGFVKTDDAGVAQDPIVGSNIFGRAVKAAGAAGEIIPVLVTREGVLAATDA